MNLKLTISALALLFNCAILQAQKFNETIKKEIAVEGNSGNKFLVVENIYGGIKVESHSGNTILLEVDKQITADNETAMEQGKSAINIKVATVNGNIHVYTDSPYSTFNEETGEFEYRENNSRRKYRYRLDYRIKVPRQINLELRAVNHGDIEVVNVHANELIINNINGAISLTNVSGKTEVNAINENINISYDKNPSQESYYKSINGDINITLKEDLNANVTFKSLNGEFYTNINSVSASPSSSVERSEGRKGTKYKWDSNTGFKMGNGGVKLHFDVLNGDVTIKR